MTASGPRSSRLAQLTAALTSASMVLILVSLIGVQVGLLAPMTSFFLFAIGALLGGLLSALLGGIAALLTRGGADPLGFKRALSSLVVGIGLLVLVAVAGAPGADVPPINDITNNLESPPAFDAAKRTAANRDRDMGYPESFKPQVKEAYGDLHPFLLDATPADCFADSLQAAKNLGWTLIDSNPAKGTFEAEDRTAIFRFVDDVAVRVRPTSAGCAVDVRSKSRDGQGDLGANANRIRTFGEELDSIAGVSH